MELDPKLAQKVLDADLANMAKRVNEGKNLTANQRAHFMQATGHMPLPATGLAKNKVECFIFFAGPGVLIGNLRFFCFG